MKDRLRYLGVLGLLCECSVYVPDDVRDSIQRALEDASDEGVGYRQILNRFELFIESVEHSTDVCDCQNPEPSNGVALISNTCPIHG